VRPVREVVALGGLEDQSPRTQIRVERDRKGRMALVRHAR
jgi:hypothetical protein